MLTGRHYQNAYVTRDVDAAVARFRQDATPRQVMEITVPVKLWTPAGEGEGAQKLAFVWIDDLQVELIQPISGDVLSLYRDALPADDGLRFHHVCHLVDDWDDFYASVDRQRFPLVLRGGTPGMLEFAYFDMREWLGHYVEYCWMVPERWAQMGGR